MDSILQQFRMCVFQYENNFKLVFMPVDFQGEGDGRRAKIAPGKERADGEEQPVSPDRG